jgi:PAS domain S-box-containing protein
VAAQEPFEPLNPPPLRAATPLRAPSRAASADSGSAALLELGSETLALLDLPRRPALEEFQACIHPDDRMRFDRALGTLVRTSSPVIARVRFTAQADQRFALRLRYVAGTAFVRTIPLSDGTATDVFASIAVSTARREARLSLASYATRDIVWEWEVASGIYHFSRRLAELLGYEKLPRQLDMNGFAALLHPDDVISEERVRRRHISDNVRYDIDYRLRDANGRYRWFRSVAETCRDENGMALSMAGTLSDIDALKFAERELMEQRNQLERVTRELQDMSVRLINSQESERRHIARELHDQTGQTLTAAVLDLEFWRGKGVPPEEVEQVLASVKRALSEIRDISLQLRPPLLDEAGLENALRAYLERQAAAGKFEMTFSSEGGQTRRLKPQVEITAFRLVQEAVTNIVRHAKAAFVDVSLKTSSSDLVIRISDNGSGCVATEALTNATSGSSLGLISMNERAALVGGRCEFISSPGIGSIVLARIPLG